MRMYDLIQKKKMGIALDKEELHYMIKGYVNGEIPDYQIAAFLMAVYFKGMEQEELTAFTMEMAYSGEMADLSHIPGIKVDKHSTGGVGDKTTLIIGPIVAACGGKVAKMSGRGLGHTGGTIDKLESIPGFQTELSQEKFYDIVKRTGLSVIGQSGDFVPADKKLYALRDVTATVDSLPLIAASIMSKKIASGSDKILLDVTTGSGALLTDMEDSIKLAKIMVEIGERAGRQTAALITNMDIPLGSAIGNALEVKEAIAVLNGSGPKDLCYVCIHLAANMLWLSGFGMIEDCLKKAEQALEDGSALEAFCTMVQEQGGDVSYIRNPEKFPQSSHTLELKAAMDGYITHMDTKQCGTASVILGAGRKTKESRIDSAAGIKISHKTGEFVHAGDVLAVLYGEDEKQLEEARLRLEEAYTIGNEKPEEQPLIYTRITLS